MFIDMGMMCFRSRFSMVNETKAGIGRTLLQGLCYSASGRLPINSERFALPETRAGIALSRLGPVGSPNY